MFKKLREDIWVVSVDSTSVLLSWAWFAQIALLDQNRFYNQHYLKSQQNKKLEDLDIFFNVREILGKKDYVYYSGYV